MLPCPFTKLPVVSSRSESKMLVLKGSLGRSSKITLQYEELPSSLTRFSGHGSPAMSWIPVLLSLVYSKIPKSDIKDFSHLANFSQPSQVSGESSQRPRNFSAREAPSKPRKKNTYATTTVRKITWKTFLTSKKPLHAGGRYKNPIKTGEPPKSFLCCPHFFRQRKVPHWSRVVYGFLFPASKNNKKRRTELWPDLWLLGQCLSTVQPVFPMLVFQLNKQQNHTQTISSTVLGSDKEIPLRRASRRLPC